MLALSNLESKVRKCNKCKELKSFSEFHKSNKTLDGVRHWCKICEKAQTNRWNSQHPEAVRARNLNYKFKMTTEQYIAKLEQQGGICRICKRSDLPMVVDHCHATNIVRGILCKNCNTGIGMFNDSEELLLAAITYLKG